MPLPLLEPESLTVLIFGPGFGELAAVRAPPGVWMIVDGCEVGDIRYAQRVLDHYQAAPPRLIALTHPHDDHSGGLREVIDRATPYDQKDTWPKIGMVLPADATASNSAVQMHVASITADLIGAVRARWEDHPPCRWDMNRGDEMPLGDALVRVLSPDPAQRKHVLDRWSAGKKFDKYKNRISTVLEIEWKGRRLVLGSDLPEKWARGWTESIAFRPALTDHDLLKVPHHGSVDALHDDVLRRGARVPEPLRLIAPFRQCGLPRFTVDEGVHRIQAHAGKTYLTGLPLAHGKQSGNTEVRSRLELEQYETLTFTPTTAGFPDCFVFVSFPPDGGPPRVEQGPGSILVTR